MKEFHCQIVNIDRKLSSQYQFFCCYPHDQSAKAKKKNSSVSANASISKGFNFK